MQISPSSENPFVGLRPFESVESLIFFGRGAQTGELLERLHSRRFVSVVGRSGCGKSSLIRAGLIPKLKAGFLVADRDRWIVATMKPGDRPLYNLAAAILEATGDKPTTEAVATLAGECSAGGVEPLTKRLERVLDAEEANFLLLADQFEEIFRFGVHTREDEESEEDAAAVRKRDEAADFVSIMLSLSEQRVVPVYVVMTMRSDFLGDCDAFHGLPEAMNHSQYLVPRLSTQQREEAISGPIRLYGQTITPQLLDLVRNDVGDKLDQLPVMQHAMMRTWENWQASSDGAIDVPDYRAAGTIKSALSDDAEDVLRELGDEESDERKLTMLVFQALTDTDSENRRIRRPKRLKELAVITGADGEKIMEIVALFQGGGRSFLTVTPDDMGDHLIDISHESLIRQWKTLRAWVDKEAEWRSIYLRIADAAVRRKTKGGGLWDDPDLQQALDWWEEKNPTRAWAEQYHTAKKTKTSAHRRNEPDLDIYAESRNFLEESRLARERARDEKKRARKREVRSKRMLFLLIFLLVTTVPTFGFFITKARKDAADRQKVYFQQQAVIEARLKDEALRREKAERSAREKLERSEEERFAALDTARKNAKEAEENAKEADEAKLEAQKQEGIAKANAEKANVALIAAREQTEKALQENERAENLVYTSNINIIEDSEEEGDSKRSNEVLVSHLPESWKADSPRAASTDVKEMDRRSFEWFYFWRLNHKGERRLKADGVGDVYSMAFSPKGQTLAVSHSNGLVKLWDTEQGKEIAMPEGQPKASALAVAYSPDGKTLAISREDNTVSLFDIQSKAEFKTLVGLKSVASVVAFSPDGRRLAAAGKVELKLWDANTFNEIKLSEESSDDIRTIAFSLDGQTLATAGNQGVYLWEASSGKKRLKVTSEESVSSLAFSRQAMATGNTEGIVTLFVSLLGADAVKYNSFKAHDGYITSMAFLGDGATLVTAGRDGTTKLWNADSEKRLAILNNDNDISTVIALSSDNKTLATNGIDGVVKLWDLTLLRGYIEPHTSSGSSVFKTVSVAYSPDRRVLASLQKSRFGEAGHIKVWDTTSYDKRPRVLKRDEDGPFSGMAFSPDSRTLAASDREGKLHLFDTTSWKETTEVVETLANVSSASLAFSHDGQMLAISGSDSIAVLNTRTWQEDLVIDGKAPIAFSSQGILAVASEESTVRLWDVALKRQIGETDSNEGDVIAIALSPYGQTLAVASDDNTIRLWDASSLRRDVASPQRLENPKLLIGHKYYVNSLAFSPDGKTLASSSGLEKTVRLWSTATQRMLATLKGHTNMVTCMAFSSDGKSLATGDSRGEVKVWRAATDEDVKMQCQCGPPGR